MNRVESSQYRLKKQNTSYDPAYWHVTGDSFPASGAVVGNEVAVIEKPEAASKIKLRLEDIQDAHTRIKEDVVCTPVLAAKELGKKFCKVIFKCENLQNTGSFKARGACNVLLSMAASEKSKGVTVSGGRNFLSAMTYYGHKFSVPMNVVVPKDCPLCDKQRYRENFAIVKQYGNDNNEAGLHALSYSEEIGPTFVTWVGLEILSQVDNLDAVICPVGSGGLVASLVTSIKSLKPNCAIYGVESASSPAMTRALQENKPVMVQLKSSTADSLAYYIASNNAFNVVRGYLDRIITVDETWIARAMIVMLEREKMLVEGAAACPVAAIMAEKMPELQGKTVVCVLTGRNINSSRVGRAIERGMAAEGRLVKFTTKLQDSPGAFAKLITRISNYGADVRSFVPERVCLRLDITTIAVNMVIETTDLNHSKDLEKMLKKEYPKSNVLIV